MALAKIALPNGPCKCPIHPLQRNSSPLSIKGIKKAFRVNLNAAA